MAGIIFPRVSSGHLDPFEMENSLIQNIGKAIILKDGRAFS